MMLHRKDLLGGKAFPFDEAVEYLESNGNQYVDTGIRGVSGLNIHLEFFPIYPVSTDYQDYFGGSNGDTVTGYRIRNDAGKEWYISVFVGKAVTWSLLVPEDEWITFRTENDKAYLNDNCWNVGSSYPGQKLFLHSFCSWESNFRNSNVRIRKFSVDGIANYIPCLKDGVPCYYNDTDGTFKYNEVSGHQFGYKKKDGTIVEPS